MRFLISAGPTRERIDAVRFLSNYSSGKMGYALAAAALKAGHQVVLVSGPVCLAPPAGIELVAVESAAEMARAVHAAAPAADIVIMAAAVADYRPVNPLSEKMKKSPGGMTLELERTEDILATLGKHKLPGQMLVGFAAETMTVEEYAKAKLKSKNLDWIIANDVSKPGLGFASDRNAAVMLSSTGERLVLPPALKTVIAAKIIARLEQAFTT